MFENAMSGDLQEPAADEHRHSDPGFGQNRRDSGCHHGRPDHVRESCAAAGVLGFVEAIFSENGASGVGTVIDHSLSRGCWQSYC